MPTLQDIVSLAKRRGYFYPGSEIYGGLGNTWDYGPLGVALKKNLKDLWWKTFVTKRHDIVGLDASIISSKHIWQASGHVASFADLMVDCKSCKTRLRVDHLIEDYFAKKSKPINVEGIDIGELERLIKDNKIPCPKCGGKEFTAARAFNLLFGVNLGSLAKDEDLAYLRGETAQGIFTNFKNVLDSTRVKLPFGIAQLGKSFRNEITKGQSIFRMVEFEQAEIEYFFDPDKSDWEALFDAWLNHMTSFLTDKLGLKSESIRVREHTDDERSFYSKRTVDIEYNFPFGFKELWGLAFRTDYDLQAHIKHSNVDLSYRDGERRIVPHVIEPAVGIDRLFLAVLANSLWEDKVNNRLVLSLKPELAPYRVAVFPLVKNNVELVEKAKSIFEALSEHFPALYDDRGNIGKRYYYQDEMGTPTCLTVDYQTLEDGTVTLRDRDTTEQIRVNIEDISDKLS